MCADESIQFSLLVVALGQRLTMSISDGWLREALTSSERKKMGVVVKFAIFFWTRILATVPIATIATAKAHGLALINTVVTTLSRGGREGQ